MRILQIGPVTPEWGGRETGGIATHLVSLATHLARAGHEVGVLAGNRPYDPGAWPVTVEGVHVFGTRGFAGAARATELIRPPFWLQLRQARGALVGLGSLTWQASSTAAFRLVARTFSPDVVHVHALESRLAFARATIPGIPTVVTAHSTHYFEFAPPEAREQNRAIIRTGLAGARDVVFVSHYLEARYRELFGEQPHIRARVIPNPIDAGVHEPIDRQAARSELGLSPRERVLLFVGNLIPRKDADTLVRAVAELRRGGTDVTLLVLGEGPEEAALRARAQSEGVADRVRFEGRKLQAELARYYSAADLFVFPSLMESFGLVALEAMLCGTPVIGTAEVLTEVVPPACGMHVPPQDPPALARAIESALGAAWDRSAIRRHALGYDWSERIGEFETLYAEVLRSGTA